MSQKKKITNLEKEEFDKRYWTMMINSLSGFKSANLIASVSKEKVTNLSMISSVFHLGAKPPLMGFVLRPHTNKSPRHTYQNIKDTDFFTINHVTNKIYKKAHQTSARYPRDISEFSECGLKEDYQNDFPVPFVKDSPIQIAMKALEIIDIQQNATHLVIGEIQFFLINKELLKKDGYIDIEQAGSLAVSGLDSYHEVSRLNRLSYAKPDKELKELDINGEVK